MKRAPPRRGRRHPISHQEGAQRQEKALSTMGYGPRLSPSPNPNQNKPKTAAELGLRVAQWGDA